MPVSSYLRRAVAGATMLVQVAAPGFASAAEDLIHTSKGQNVLAELQRASKTRALEKHQDYDFAVAMGPAGTHREPGKVHPAGWYNWYTAGGGLAVAKKEALAACEKFANRAGVCLIVATGHTAPNGTITMSYPAP